MSTEAKCLSVANVAYEVIAPGLFRSDSDWFRRAGFVELPYGIVAGPDAINAALVGKILGDDGKPQTIIAFRGTVAPDDETKSVAERIEDWLGDFDARMIEHESYPGMVHEGFANALDTLLTEIIRHVGTDTGIIACGHSKGGALAVLAAACGKLPIEKVVTFGAPRAGNQVFAEYFNSWPMLVTRYENHLDLVPHVPAEPHIAEALGRLIGKELPAFDYRAVGHLEAIASDGTISSPVLDFGHSVLDEAAILEHLIRGDFASIRAAHAISVPGKGYGVIAGRD